MIDSSTQTDAASREQSPKRLRELAFGSDVATAAHRRKRERARRDVLLGTRGKTHRLHMSLVPEPHLTPLACINYLMDSFGVDRVTVAEAAAAVEKVTQYYTALSQATPQLSSGDVPGTGRRRRTRQLRGEASASQAALSQQSAAASPESLSVLATLSASQVNLTQQSANTFVTDVQDALLLEVVRELCVRRPLRLTRVSYRDQRRMRERLSRVDVPPGKRAIIFADRRDPFFSVILGVPRPRDRPALHGQQRTHGDDDPEEEEEEEGDTAAAVAIEYITMAHKPIPWRRMVHRNIRRMSHKECAIAYIERLEDGEETDRYPGRSVDSKDSPSSESRSPRRRMTVVLGCDESDHSVEEDEEVLDASTMTSPSQRSLDTERYGTEQRVKRARMEGDDGGMVFPPSGTSSDNDDGGREGEGWKEKRDDTDIPFQPLYRKSLPIPRHEQLFYSSKPYFTEEMAAGGAVEDPLMTIPRVDVVGDRKSRRKTWAEKLLPRDNMPGREATMGKLYRHASPPEF